MGGRGPLASCHPPPPSRAAGLAAELAGHVPATACDSTRRRRLACLDYVDVLVALWANDSTGSWGRGGGEGGACIVWAGGSADPWGAGAGMGCKVGEGEGMDSMSSLLFELD